MDSRRVDGTKRYSISKLPRYKILVNNDAKCTIILIFFYSIKEKEYEMSNEQRAINNVYINKTSSFLPNDPVGNDEIEEIIGQIGGNASRAKSLILKKNQIKTRYYSLNKKGQIVYSNAEMSALAIKKLFSADFLPKELELLACGSSSADQLMPCHASMVHGLLPETSNLSIISPSGVCASAMQGLYCCYNAIKAGTVNNAITAGSELASPVFRSNFFETEYNKLAELMVKPRIAFEEDFLRFMLSDGAGAFLMSHRLVNGVNFEVNWVESFSFANEMPSCMTLGCEVTPEKKIISWKEIAPESWAETGVFAIKQDANLVEYCVPYAAKTLVMSEKKHPFEYNSVDYFLPHISSMYFYEKLIEQFREEHLAIPESSWYVPLPEVGNIGSASIYVALDRLQADKDLNDGQKVLLFIPESSRFNFYYIMLTVRVH